MSFFAARRGRNPPSIHVNGCGPGMPTTSTTMMAAASDGAMTKLVTLTRKVAHPPISLKERELSSRAKRERQLEREYAEGKEWLQREREEKRRRMAKGKNTPRTMQGKVKIMNSEDDDEEEELGTPVNERKGPLKVLRESMAAPKDMRERVEIITGERVVRENISAYVQCKQYQNCDVIGMAHSLSRLLDFLDLPMETTTRVEYPGDNAYETYLLLRPRVRDQQDYHPIQDIIATVRVVCDYFLTAEQAMESFRHIPFQSSSALGEFNFLNATNSTSQSAVRDATPFSDQGTPEPPPSGILTGITARAASMSSLNKQQPLLRRLEKAYRRKNGQAFLEALSHYNTELSVLKNSGNIRANIVSLGQTQGLPESVWQRITGQCYERTVGPRVEELKKYQAFSDNTYGELLPPFIAQIAALTNLKPESVMVDMGSGVGNCCVQASLATGCTSYGFENQAAAASIAVAQTQEAIARARLWGLSGGPCESHEADFLASPGLVGPAIQKADLVLINNYVFSPTTNESLSLMFLDLKDGAKVVSLKPFVQTSGETAINCRNVGSPANILVQSKPLRFDRGCVSWSAEGGVFYMAEVNRNRLKEYLEENKDRA